MVAVRQLGRRGSRKGSLNLDYYLVRVIIKKHTKGSRRQRVSSPALHLSSLFVGRVLVYDEGVAVCPRRFRPYT